MDKTEQLLFDMRETLERVKHALNFQRMTTKDGRVERRLLNAHDCILQAIEQIVLAVDDVRHSVMYREENKDG